jgi:hypothetical protein
MSVPDALDEWMVTINCLVTTVETSYKTTSATATECLTQLDDKLMALGVEPDCVGLWQVLYLMVEDENEWDSLSAVEQARKDMPKGKNRQGRRDASYTRQEPGSTHS